MSLDSNIFDTIIKTMAVAQKEKVNDKKAFVMYVLKQSMPTESYERYEPYISITIDLLKQLSKDGSILKGLKNSKCLSCI